MGLMVVAPQRLHLNLICRQANRATGHTHALAAQPHIEVWVTPLCSTLQHSKHLQVKRELDLGACTVAMHHNCALGAVLHRTYACSGGYLKRACATHMQLHEHCWPVTWLPSDHNLAAQ
jgi:hypothetical protein